MGDGHSPRNVSMGLGVGRSRALTHMLGLDIACHIGELNTRKFLGSWGKGEPGFNGEADTRKRQWANQKSNTQALWSYNTWHPRWARLPAGDAEQDESQSSPSAPRASVGLSLHRGWAKVFLPAIAEPPLKRGWAGLTGERSVGCL